MMMRPVDQAARLRERLEAMLRKKAPTTLAIVGSKGGSGATSVALNLGIALSNAQKEVLLVDAAFSGGALDILAGATPNMTMGDLLDGEHDVREVVERIYPGVELLACGGAESRLALATTDELDCLFLGIDRFARAEDVVLIDCGSGLSSGLCASLAMAGNVLVVTTPEPASVAGAYAIIREVGARRRDCRFSLLVNQASGLPEAIATRERVEALCRKYLNRVPAYLGMVPLDERMHEAVMRQAPCVLQFPKAAATRAFESIATLLVGGAKQGAFSLGDAMKGMLELRGRLPKFGEGRRYAYLDKSV